MVRAAFTCGNYNNDFSILDYLFDEYGLSLKDPKYNLRFVDMKHIKEANEKYILMKEVEDDPCIYE
ncbi:ankyrin repeat domain-containing protein, partial [Campylobacter peloridis]